MIRIGVDARLMHHQPAGISRYTWHLLRALARMNDEDQFTIFQHRNHRSPLIEQENFRRATLYSPVHSWLEQLLLPLELLRFPLDLLHSTDFIPPLRSTIPTVITVHDLAFLHWPHFVTKVSAAYYGQIDRAVRHARHIIVPSESTKQDLGALLGVPSDKVSVIYEAADPIFAPAADPGAEAQARAYVRRQYGLPETFVLFVGTIEPRKNVSGLLEAFRHLLDKYSVEGVGLAIAGGRGWLYREVLAMIDSLKLRNSVHLLGRVPDEDLRRLYIAARCHVHPAHYEGFGLPPLEAMACGTPTIVSNVSSLPEVVGDAAILIDPKNWEEMAVAMNRLITDDALHAELRAKGLQRAKLFSWDLAAEKTMDVYRQVAGEASTVRPLVPRPSSSRSATSSRTATGSK
jgi:glycosyltransferase involved in cell wall biosynthesis